MIRHHITQADWQQAIDDISSTWMSRAGDRTADYLAANRFVKNPPSTIWSEIKRVYMDLQGFKCGFCERKLEQSEFGNVEHDVEHFRPKGIVTDWPPASAPERGDGIDFTLGTAADPGYFLLAHHPENYLISCKTCNSSLKGNGFPVDGDRDIALAEPRHTAELPYLVYPLGTSSLDDDPEALIAFEGIVPVPAAASGRRRRRGQVIINFFQLAEREGLLEERSIVIMTLSLALASLDHPDALTQTIAQQTVARLTSNSSAHTNCARCFHHLWLTNRADAAQFSQLALDHIVSLP